MTSRRSEVDTRRPFRSVKEAVAVFGDRLLAGEAYFQSKPRSPPPPSPSYSTSSSKFNQGNDDEELSIILGSMKKLEAELAETKREVTMLKAKMEAMSDLKVASDRWGVEEDEEIMEVKYEYLPSLANGDEFNERKEKAMKKKKKKKKNMMMMMMMMKKKKPIVPLIGDLFSRKKDYGEIHDSL